MRHLKRAASLIGVGDDEVGRIIDRREVAAPEQGHADRHHEADGTLHQGVVREFGLMGVANGGWAAAVASFRAA